MATSAVLRRSEHKPRSRREGRKVKRTVLHWPCSRPAVSNMRSSAGSVGFVFVRSSFRTDDWKPDALPSLSTKGCQFLRPDIRFANDRLAIRTLNFECTHRWSKPVPKQLSCQDFSCSNCKPPTMKSNCVKALSATRLQVQLSAIGMLVSSLLSMHKPCCNTHLASNCPRALRLPSPQVPKTAESYPFWHAPRRALKFSTQQRQNWIGGTLVQQYVE